MDKKRSRVPLTSIMPTWYDTHHFVYTSHQNLGYGIERHSNPYTFLERNDRLRCQPRLLVRALGAELRRYQVGDVHIPEYREEVRSVLPLRHVSVKRHRRDM